jgi:hypothetical protein
MGRGTRAQIGSVLRFFLPVVAFAVAGWSATASAVLPAPDELVPNTVARISDVPDRTGTITKAEFRHALVLAAAGRERLPVPKPGGRGYELLKRSAVLSLIETIWIKGQAAEMNIVVTRSQVLRELALIKKQNFASAAEYRKFLRRWRFTRRDVYEQIELQLLSIRIQQRIAEGAESEAEEQKAFDEFITEFNERWRSRTVCAPEYVIAHCSNGPAWDP